MMSEGKGNFWTTLPGILTGLASVITAVAGLVYAMNGGDPAAAPGISPAGEAALSSTAVEKAPVIQLNKLVANAANVAAQAPVEQAMVQEQVKMPSQTQAQPQSQAQPQTLPQAVEPSPAIAITIPLEKVVNCNSKRMLNNSVDSLMSWSNHYFEEAQAHQGSASQRSDCEKLLQYRASAWCKDKSEKISNALIESLKLCKVDSTLGVWSRSR